MSFSIVIICRDEEKHIGRCIDAIIGLSDDIIVIDTGSTDQTIEILKTYPVKLLQLDWTGYGATKNHGALVAKHDWILSIDADEVVSKELYQSIQSTSLREDKVYSIRRVNYIGDRGIRFGHLKPEIKTRLFIKNVYQWDNKPVHELLSPTIDIDSISLLQGDLLHYQAKDLQELQEKYIQYAGLSEKKSNQVTAFFGSIYYFIKSYFLQLGLLEGGLGFRLAILFSQYKKLKSNP